MIRGNNGMNLSSGEREIPEALNNWNQQKVEVFLHQENIKRKFNFHERMIRLVRKILRALFKQQLVLETHCQR